MTSKRLLTSLRMAKKWKYSRHVIEQAKVPVKSPDEISYGSVIQSVVYSSNTPAKFFVYYVIKR